MAARRLRRGSGTGSDSDWSSELFGYCFSLKLVGGIAGGTLRSNSCVYFDLGRARYEAMAASILAAAGQFVL